MFIKQHWYYSCPITILFNNTKPTKHSNKKPQTKPQHTTTSGTQCQSEINCTMVQDTDWQNHQNLNSVVTTVKWICYSSPDNSADGKEGTGTCITVNWWEAWFLSELLVRLLITEKMAEEQPRKQESSITFLQKPHYLE